MKLATLPMVLLLGTTFSVVITALAESNLTTDQTDESANTVPAHRESLVVAQTNSDASQSAVLVCGEATVMVKTLCDQPDGVGSSYCQNQTIRILSHSPRTYKMNYLPPPEPQSFIVAASCLSSSRGNIIELQSTDFGNCANCEWSDYFLPTGEYIGSTRTSFGSYDFKYRKISSDFAQILRLASESKSVQITRPHEP